MGAYLCFYCGETLLHLSGLLAVCTMGVVTVIVGERRREGGGGGEMRARYRMGSRREGGLAGKCWEREHLEGGRPPPALRCAVDG